MLPKIDIYFDKNYGKLYEKAENGTAEFFELKTKNGTIINQFIKRKIPQTIDDKDYYDIATPYGYGGPMIVEAYDKNALLEEYEQSFHDYCRKNNIVSEFVRFHPIFKNYEDFKDIYNSEFNRFTLATNIKGYDDPVASEFSKHCKKTIRQILKSGVTFNMIEKPTKENLDIFVDIYYQNMRRKEAEDYYFFDHQYFNDIYKNFKNNIIIAESVFNNEVIAAGLYFKTDSLIHAHLSGTKTDFLQMSPAYILKYGTAKWAKEHNIDYIHYGGGTDTSEQNNLYQFKSKFAKNTKFEFWIGKKIWNKDIYNLACKITGIDKDTDFFPAYRSTKK